MRLSLFASILAGSATAASLTQRSVEQELAASDVYMPDPMLSQFDTEETYPSLYWFAKTSSADEFEQEVEDIGQSIADRLVAAAGPDGNNSFKDLSSTIIGDALEDLGIPLSPAQLGRILTGSVSLFNATTPRQFLCGARDVATKMPLIGSFVSIAVSAGSITAKAIGGTDKDACTKSWYIRKFSTSGKVTSFIAAANEFEKKNPIKAQFVKSMAAAVVPGAALLDTAFLDPAPLYRSFKNGVSKAKNFLNGKDREVLPVIQPQADCPDGYKTFAGLLCVKDECPKPPSAATPAAEVLGPCGLFCATPGYCKTLIKSNLSGFLGVVKGIGKLIMTGGMDPFAIANIIAGIMKVVDVNYHKSCPPAETPAETPAPAETDATKSELITSALNVLEFCMAPEAKLPKQGRGTDIIKAAKKAGKICDKCYDWAIGVKRRIVNGVEEFEEGGAIDSALSLIE